jgi:hypothetical protein
MEITEVNLYAQPVGLVFIISVKVILEPRFPLFGTGSINLGEARKKIP